MVLCKQARARLFSSDPILVAVRGTTHSRERLLNVQGN